MPMATMKDSSLADYTHKVFYICQFGVVREEALKSIIIFGIIILHGDDVFFSCNIPYYLKVPYLTLPYSISTIGLRH